MKNAFRQSMAWLHTWLGLLFGWLLYFIFITGTVGYLDTEIDRWMRPELPAAIYPLPAQPAIRQASEFLHAHAGNARRWTIILPIDRNAPYLQVSWQAPRGAPPAASSSKPAHTPSAASPRTPSAASPSTPSATPPPTPPAARFGASGTAYLDPTSGQVLPTRDTGGGQTLYQMHWRLHYLPVVTSEWIVGIATLAMLIGLITGIVVHKKIFTDFFTFRARKGQRSWLDAHNAISVITLPFQLMITYSGLVFLMFTIMPLIIVPWYGTGKVGQGDFLNEVFTPLSQTRAAGRPAPMLPLDRIVQDAQGRWGAAPVTVLEIQDPGDANARVIVIGDFSAGPLRATDILVYDAVSGEVVNERPTWQSGPKAFRDLMLGLHEGQFAPPAVRLFYVLSGLMGAAMIATGMVLWTVKRRKRAELGRQSLHAGLRLVERMNVAVVIGLPVAIAAYFWANRLLSLDMANRAAWEVHVLFVMWLGMFVHAALRPAGRIWPEQAWIAVGMFMMLPVVNALTTTRHLGRSVVDGDWGMAAFDLSLLGLGAAFCGLAIIVKRRLPPQKKTPPV